MQVTYHTGELLTAAVDLLILGVFQGEALEGPVKGLDRALGGALKAAAKDEDFTGKNKQRLVINTLGKLKAKRVALLGLGKGEQTASALVNLGGTATRLGRDVGAKSVVLVLPTLDSFVGEPLELVARGVRLGAYRYLAYKSDKSKKPWPERIAIKSSDASVARGAKEAFERAQVIAKAVALARDLVNESPLTLYPEALASRAVKLARAAGVRAKVFGPAELKRMGMNLLLGVGGGSSRLPRLVHLTYAPKGRAAGKAPIVLIGKGITFDSGGLSLKPSASMEDMKIDMAGSAAVLATMCALGALDANVHVHGLMAIAENMPSGTAIRPGDVIESAAGKTVEVNNTDAEGRLVLADAIHYAHGLKPKCLIDLATLTGACMVALGTQTGGLFANNDELAGKLLRSAERAGEHFWRLPLSPLLKDQLKSDVADLKNTGAREGGAITAALFLAEFVGQVPWVHLDIAGPASTRQDSGADSKGGTGVAVATLLDYLAN